MSTSARLRGVVAVAVLAIAGTLMWGCGDDDKVAGPGSGNSGPTVFQFDAGEYELTVAAWVCGAADTIRETLTVTLCDDAVPGSDNYDEFSFCDTTWVDGNGLTANCESEWVPFEGCTVITDYDLSGIVTGNTWAVAGTLMYWQTPPDCFDIDCMVFDITTTRTGPAPDRCQYGDLDAIDMTVTGAPFASDVMMSARGYQREDMVAWDVLAEATVDDVSQDPIEVYFVFGTPEFDPNDLPKVFNVVYDDVPAAGNLPDVGAYYSEWSPYPDHQQLFSATSATGTLTIEAASDEFFAGSFDIDWTGQQGSPNPGPRNTTGTFNVENRNFGGTSRIVYQGRTRSTLAERLLRAASELNAQ